MPPLQPSPDECRALDMLFDALRNGAPTAFLERRILSAYGHLEAMRRPPPPPTTPANGGLRIAA